MMAGPVDFSMCKLDNVLGRNVTMQLWDVAGICCCCACLCLPALRLSFAHQSVHTHAHTRILAHIMTRGHLSSKQPRSPTCPCLTGQESFRSIVSAYLRGAAGYVFAVDGTWTLAQMQANLRRWHEFISAGGHLQHSEGQAIPAILIVTKVAIPLSMPVERVCICVCVCVCVCLCVYLCLCVHLPPFAHIPPSFYPCSTSPAG